MTLVIVLSLLVLGLLLLAVEAFIIPGFGIPGIVGALLLIGGAVLAWNEYGTAVGLSVVGGSVLIAVLLSVGIARSRAARRMVLNAPNSGDSADLDPLRALIGTTGVAVTPLRPSGAADFGGRREQVMSDGDFIARGMRVRALRVETNTLFVAPIDDPASPGPAAVPPRAH